MSSRSPGARGARVACLVTALALALAAIGSGTAASADAPPGLQSRAPDAGPTPPSGAVADATPPPQLGAQSPPPAVVDAASTPTVRATPAQLRLGVDRATQLEVVGVDATAPQQLELVASVGTVRDVARVGPGRFTAVYEPPAGRAPDVAVIVARRRGDVNGALGVVPLAGRYHLTLTVEPSARVSVRVGAAPPREAVASATGAIDLMVHVPPGIDAAHITATDRAGNTAETREALELPPLHRVMLLPVAAPAHAGVAVRWLVAAASADGAPASRAPELGVDGAPFEVAVPPGAPPGLFVVTARPPRQLAETTVTLRVREAGVAAVPAALAVSVPPAVPRSLALRAPAAVRVGESLVAELVVRDADGADVTGLEGALSARLGERQPARIEARSGAYVVLARAPEQPGAIDLVARLAGGGASVETRASITVTPAPAARLVLPSPAPTLGIDAEQAVTLRALDRYGNAAAIGHPSAQAAGATVISVRAAPGSVRLALVAHQPVVRITLRGDYDLNETVTLAAAGTVVRPFALGVVVTGRWNFGALGLFGGRVRFDGTLALRAPRWLALGAMVEAGVEGGVAVDAQMRAARVIAVPLAARLGAWARVGAFSIGPFGGLGVRFVQVDAHLGDGTMAQQGAASLLVSAALIARVATRIGVFGGEVGVEGGSLDTTVARGTLGGLYGGLGWSLGF